jgi:hypothetical protein
MDLHVYRNAQDRWHDLRSACREHGAALAINRYTLSELVEKLTPEAEVATVGQQLALIRKAVPSPAGTRPALEAIRQLKSAGVRGHECEFLAAYDRALRKAGLMDVQDRVWLATSRVAERSIPWLRRFKRVVLHTIYDPTEAEFSLIQNLIESVPDGAEVILFNSTANVKPTQFAEWTWQRFIRDESLAERTFPEFCRSSSPNGPVIERLFAFGSAGDLLNPLDSLRIVEAPGRYSEVEFIGSEVSRLLANGVNPRDIAVAVRHIETYGEMIEDVFRRFGIPFRFQTGVPLLRIPFIKYWFSLLDLVTSERSRDDLARVIGSAYFEPRLSPHVDIERELASFGYIDRHHLPASDLARRRNSELTAELHRFETLVERLQSSMRTAAEFFAEFRPPDTLTHRDREAWSALADELHAVDTLAGNLSFDEFRAIALDICATKTIDRLSSDAEVPRFASVDILHPGSLGYRTYKWIFAPGMVDGEFPSATWANPLLPEETLEALNKAIRPRRLLTPRDEHRREPLYLFMLLDSVLQRTTLTFPSGTMDGEPIVPSMYIGEIDRHFASDLIEQFNRSETIHDAGECRRRIASDWKKGSIDNAAAQELLGIDVTQRVALEERGAARADVGRNVVPIESAWHPSELNALAACPFVFLARHRLALRSDDLPEFEVAPREIGKFAHDILRLFYSSPIPTSETIAAQRMSEIVERRLADADIHGQGVSSVFEPALWKIRRRQLVAALEQYVRFAVKDALEGFQTMTEYLDNPLPRVALGSIVLGGRPDHVAVRRVGTRVEGIRIDDFKYSAASAFTAKLLKDSFQIPVYAHLAAKALRADESTQIEGRYLLLRSPSTPVIAHGIDAPLLDELKIRIETLLDKVRNGLLHPDPIDRQDCTSCSYRRLCRLYGA